MLYWWPDIRYKSNLVELNVQSNSVLCACGFLYGSIKIQSSTGISGGTILMCVQNKCMATKILNTKKGEREINLNESLWQTCYSGRFLVQKIWQRLQVVKLNPESTITWMQSCATYFVYCFVCHVNQLHLKIYH